MSKTSKISPDLEHQVSLSRKMRELLASLQLEGIELSSDAMADVKLFDTDKITKEEFIKRALDRARSKTD